MTLKIINFPNPILSETMPVFDFDNPPIDPKELEKNLIDTMLANKGVGLSANQVGIKVNVFVMGHSSDPSSAQAFFNPVIISASKDSNDMVEGCLSFPGVFLKVNGRHKFWPDGKIVMVNGKSRNLRVMMLSVFVTNMTI